MAATSNMAVALVLMVLATCYTAEGQYNNGYNNGGYNNGYNNGNYGNNGYNNGNNGGSSASASASASSGGNNNGNNYGNNYGGGYGNGYGGRNNGYGIGKRLLSIPTFHDIMSTLGLAPPSTKTATATPAAVIETQSSNVVELSDHIEIHIMLPVFMSKDAFIVEIADGSLWVTGQEESAKFEETENGKMVPIQSMQSSRFTHTMPLPCNVDVDKASSSIAGGVLTVTLPRQ